MSTVNANVNSGKTFTPDAQGQALLTLDDLNRLGLPTVTVDLSNSVAEEDLQDGAVTVDKIGALAVTEGKIGALAITEGKIGALAVTEGKIGALAVTEGKIGAAAVSAAKLADALADALLTATAVVSAEVANVITVTIAVKDIQGNVLSGMQVGVEWWLSTAAGGAVGASLATAAYTTGSVIAVFTANTHHLALTNTSGQLVMTFDAAASTGTRYFNLLIQGRYVAGSIAMTWA